MAIYPNEFEPNPRWAGSVPQPGPKVKVRGSEINVAIRKFVMDYKIPGANGLNVYNVLHTYPQESTTEEEHSEEQARDRFLNEYVTALANKVIAHEGVDTDFDLEKAALGFHLALGFGMQTLKQQAAEEVQRLSTPEQAEALQTAKERVTMLENIKTGPLMKIITEAALEAGRSKMNGVSVA